ncbi:MAG TPA: hypothetical protein VGO53_05715 [Steroidobacteraceae bacterium]|nr:hypothetical protein [Steroidobacteraceae bacterium]
MKGAGVKYTSDQIIDQIKNPRAPAGSATATMPKLLPAVLSQRELFCRRFVGTL